MAAELRRDSFKAFWDKYSDKPDTNTMMLNNSADELDASDRLCVMANFGELQMTAASEKEKKSQ
ncbi:hypothetical protein KIN20_019352 [Parelaphostrongylus tenuis]|uniref:Uncharacterized protein n=1 Tax=Parelaphostrongylus tenuis TaxID=148309 RepID=A0AAD5N4R6_PARTN|nr:hypothetical protein KIN20_019352 [Parelaphostrongylus tenuis]